jgi:hypothetical protein
MKKCEFKGELISIEPKQLNNPDRNGYIVTLLTFKNPPNIKGLDKIVSFTIQTDCELDKMLIINQKYLVKGEYISEGKCPIIKIDTIHAIKVKLVEELEEVEWHS